MEKRVKSSAADFFGTKKVTTGSKEAPKVCYVCPIMISDGHTVTENILLQFFIFLRFCFATLILIFIFVFLQTVSSKLVESKKAADKVTVPASKVKAKVTKNEIVILGSEEEWSDEESFAQLIDSNEKVMCVICILVYEQLGWGWRNF